MNQQEQFNTALAGLSPTERTAYTKANPTVNVGGVSQTIGTNNTYSPAPVNTTFDGSILGKTSALTVPNITPTIGTNPILSNPSGTTLDANGFAITNPTPKTNVAPEKTFREKAMELLNTDITTLGTKADVTKSLQEEQQLQAKRDMATASYNAYNKEQTMFNQKLAEMQNAEANTVGAVGGGFSSTIQKFEKEGRARLANMSIQANMDANNLTAAQQNIKDKLEAQFQPVQDRIDNIGKYIQLNEVVNLMKREADFRIKSQQESLDQVKKDLSNVGNLSESLKETVPTTTKSGKPFDYQSAKNSGYSDTEIQSYLNAN